MELFTQGGQKVHFIPTDWVAVGVLKYRLRPHDSHFSQ